MPPGVWGGSFFIPQAAEREKLSLQEQAVCHTIRLAPELYCSVGMTRISRKKRTIRLLRWVFQRENRLLTCQLDREGHQASYTLSLVPHWNATDTVSETFDAGVNAFRRHATVADQLRSEGWTLAAYSLAS